jgi:hypothetical protein
MEKAMAGLFQVLRGQSDGAFKKSEVLNGTNGAPLIIPVEGENWVENICTGPSRSTRTATGISIWSSAISPARSTSSWAQL